MLIIRKEQLKAFSNTQERRFTTEMVEHLKTNFPAETEEMDSDALHEYVETAFEAAKKYEITSRQDLCRFLNLTMFYGMEFEDNKDKHWMHEYLVDPEISSPGRRLERLYKECVYRLELDARNQEIRERYKHGK